MNSVLSFFEKQQGISNDLSYDFALARLRVRDNDSWKGIEPSTYGSDFNPEPPIFSAKFANCHNYRHILAIANEDGKIALQDVNKRNIDGHEEKSLEGQQCHFNAVFDLEWVPGQMKFVSASGDHTARLWCITESKIEMCRVFNGHTRSVKTAAFRKQDPAVFATGGRDGAILIWDSRASLNLSPRADNCIYSGHAGGPGTPVSNKKKTRTPKLCPNGTSSSITGLVFQDDYTLVSCGAGDGIIKVWDLRRNYTCYKKEPLPKFSLPYAGSSTFKGFTNLLIDNSGVKLFANCMDNTIYCYNLSSYSSKPIQKYVGLRNSTFYIKSCLSPDDKYLLSGSSDEKAYIWNVNNSEPLVTLNGHTVEVTCVAWSFAYDMPIVTCSDDARHKIWRIGPEKIQQDEQIKYKGNAEYCKQQKILGIRNQLKSLEYTPRSMKRLVEQNEKTPNSVEKTSMKRNFSEINNDHNSSDDGGSEQKRPHLETRGRRLFATQLASIFEETDTSINSIINHPDDSNQENTLQPKPCSSNSILNSTNKTILTERIDFNLKSPKLNSTTTARQTIIFSPTSNLPNYVLDGEAPHLHIMSPKRKTKDKVDWLTKIRKQKLMSGRLTTSLNEKLQDLTSTTITTTTGQNSNTLCDNNNEDEGNSDICLSPRLKNLKVTNDPTTTPTIIPKRRNSRSNSLNSDQTNRNSNLTKRNYETSILRFFTISTQQHQQEQQIQGGHISQEIATTNLATASCSK